MNKIKTHGLWASGASVGSNGNYVDSFWESQLTRLGHFLIKHKSSLNWVAWITLSSWQYLHLTSMEPSTSNPLKNSLWHDLHRYSVTQFGIRCLHTIASTEAPVKGWETSLVFWLSTICSGWKRNRAQDVVAMKKKAAPSVSVALSVWSYTGCPKNKSSHFSFYVEPFTEWNTHKDAL